MGNFDAFLKYRTGNWKNDLDDRFSPESVHLSFFVQLIPYFCCTSSTIGVDEPAAQAK
jgi:hypothetical protein